jgi:hypothetical protein
MKVTNYDAYSNGQLCIAWDKIMLMNHTPHALAMHKNLVSLITECDKRKIKPWDRSSSASIS